MLCGILVKHHMKWGGTLIYYVIHTHLGAGPHFTLAPGLLGQMERWKIGEKMNHTLEKVLLYTA